ncbi:MAG: hypothetical protein NDI93_00760 [Pseudomonas sp.]|nr:hypothetical protein [Pseudomonas sp.]
MGMGFLAARSGYSWVLIKEGRNMKCVNCSEEAQQIASRIDGVELDCPGCGHFGVSASVMRERQNRPFDVERTKAFLQNERDINPGRLPVIDSQNVIWAKGS